MEGAGSSSGIDDLFKKAADIKAAQLKSRPGRRAWEEAPAFFKSTALELDEIVAARKASPSEQLALAQQLKKEGNALFNQNATAEALEKYSAAISIFIWFDRGADKRAEDIPLVDASLKVEDPSIRQQVDELLTACFCNTASCLNKHSLHQDAIFAASKALEYDPYNVKALFRRAHALHELGQLELAVKDLQYAVKLEPSNAQVRQAYSKCHQEFLSLKREQAKMYAKAFEKGGMYNEASVETEAGGEGGDDSQARRQEEEEKARLAATNVEAMKRQLRRAQVRAELSKNQRTQQASYRLFPKLPWWAYTLIALHLVYRVFKLWSIPLPSRDARESTASLRDEL